MDRDEVVCIICVRSDQLVATSRAEFIGDQVGCTGGRRVGETGRPRRAFIWIGPLRHSLIRRLTRSRNHITFTRSSNQLWCMDVVGDRGLFVGDRSP